MHKQYTTPVGPDKQVTIGVPEDRLAEFYAFFGRFLAVGHPGGRRGRHDPRDRGGPRHGQPPGGHRCGGRPDAEPERPASESSGPAPDAEPSA
ncbi:MAG: hypothetical protein QOH12_3270 [Solirubrobacteraceae bacterium]|nr:hypothetical protein [Solirubrobacteraceae bacterium]